MNFLSKIQQYKLSEIIFWLFLVSLPFNKRIIYFPEKAYIQGYFSYYLAMMLYASDIMLILCFTCNIIENWQHIKNILPRYGLYLLTAVLIIFSGLISWFHVKHSISSIELYSLIKLIELIILVYLVPQVIHSLNNLRIPLVLLYISALFQGILGFWQFHVQHALGFNILGEYISQLGTGGLATIDTITGKVIRSYGTFPHPNILGGFLCLGLILGYYYVSRATKGKFWLILANISLILAIFTTFSRVAWVTAIISTVAYLVYQYSLTKKPIYWPIVNSAIVSCATILIFWHKLLLARVSNITGSNSYLERVAYNSIGWQIWKSNPFGVGIGNYISTMIAKFHVQPWDYQPPHNIFIYFGATFGWLGLAVFVAFLGKLGLDLYRSKPSDIKFLLIVSFASILLMSMFDHFLVTIQQGQLMFALVIGLILSYVKISHVAQN